MAGNGDTFFILDLNGERVMECRAPESGLEIRGAWDLPAGISSRILLKGEMSGTEFATACSEAGVPKLSSIVAVMPARLEIVRSLRLPPSAPGELAGMVKFEVESILPYPHEIWQWSFEKVAGGPDGEDIVIYAVRKDSVLNCIAMFRDSGIKLLKIYPWSACAAPFIENGVSRSAALVIPEVRELALAFTDGSRIRYNRAMKKSDSARIPAELGIALDSFPNASSLESIVLMGNSIESETVSRIGEELEKTPTSLDWATLSGAGISKPDSLDLPVAAVISASGARLAASGNGADLIPKLAPAEISARRNKLLSTAAIVLIALLAAAAVAMSVVRTNDYDARVASFENELSELAPRIENMNAVRAQLDARDENAGGIPAIELLREISVIVPVDKIRISRFFFEKNGNVGLSGQAVSHEDVMELISRMDGAGPFKDTHLDFSREVKEFDTRIINFEISAGISEQEQPAVENDNAVSE